MSADLSPWLSDCARLTLEEAQALVDSFSETEAQAILSDSDIWLREAQKPPPGDWFIWLILAGRGFGKGFAGAHCVNRWARNKDEIANGAIGIVGRTWTDMRQYQVEGPSGILATAPPDFRPEWSPGKGELRWPNGVLGICRSADEPRGCRGLNLAKLWGDEWAQWENLDDIWKAALLLGLRIGPNPQAVLTTTPRTNPPTIELVEQAEDPTDPSVVMTTGTTHDNPFLAKKFREATTRLYSGTRLGEQELGGVLLRDNPRALWTSGLIDRTRCGYVPELQRVVIGVDPPGVDDSAEEVSEDRRECGIVASGIDAKRHGYTIEDLSLAGKPEDWGQVVVYAYHRLAADAVVLEVNFGGDMAAAVIRAIDPSVNTIMVRASRGKHVRAEPASALYAQGRWHHLRNFPHLEHQMTRWQPGASWSPDRLDALVWTCHELLLAEDLAIISPLEAYA